MYFNSYLLVFFCMFATIGATSVAAESKIKVGAILPLTGELAPFGSIVREGIESANEQTVHILYEDDACLPEKAVSAYHRLSSVEHVKIFLGPCCTSSMAALAPLLKKNNQLAMNFCTGSENMFDLAGGRVFHSQYSAQADATSMAKNMWKLGIRAPIILFQESEFSRAHEKAFRESFPGKVVQTLSYTGADRDQLKSLVLSLKKLQFDAIYVPLVETFMLGFMAELKKVGVNDKKIFGIYSVQLPSLIEAQGGSVNGVIYSYPVIPGSDNATQYFAKLATQMVANEIAKCGDDIDCVKKGLVEDFLFDEHNFHAGTNLILKTIRDGKFIEYTDSMPTDAH